MRVSDEKELARALKDEQESIEMEGDLARKVFRIKATGKVAWVVAIGAIGVSAAAVLLLPTPEPTTKVAGLIAAPAAVGILGAGTAASALSIAVAAGGIGALNKLRAYKIVSHSDNKLVLKKS